MIRHSKEGDAVRYGQFVADQLTFATNIQFSRPTCMTFRANMHTSYALFGLYLSHGWQRCLIRVQSDLVD